MDLAVKACTIEHAFLGWFQYEYILYVFLDQMVSKIVPIDIHLGTDRKMHAQSCMLLR